MSHAQNLLPIGSVVRLREGSRRLMVFGVKQTGAEQKTYDYIGVLYPEGNMGAGSHFLFNHEDVEKVYFTGYSDEARTRFLDRLEAFYTEQQK